MIGNIVKRSVKTTIGLFIYSFGVYLTICANIGLAPWDCLSMGISAKTMISYGIVHTITSIIVLAIDPLLGEKIGIGSILDALLVGNFIDFFRFLDIVPTDKGLIFGIVIMVIGLFICAWGQFFYMSAGLGCGPRDSLFVGLGKRVKAVPIGVVQIGVLGVVLLIGWLLGGPVGIGTVITTFGTGTAIQIVFNALKFEPRNVEHKDVIETIRMCH